MPRADNHATRWSVSDQHRPRTTGDFQVERREAATNGLYLVPAEDPVCYTQVVEVTTTLAFFSHQLLRWYS